MRASLGDIAKRLQGELIGDPAATVDRIGTLESADVSTIGFLANPRYAAQLETTKAGCVIVAPAMRDAAVSRPSAAEAATPRPSPAGAAATIVCADPYLAFARLTQWWAAQQRGARVPGIHSSAVVEDGARIAPSASIGPLAHIGAGAVIGEHAVIGAMCHVGDGAVVGEHTELKPRVVLSHGCRIGARGIVHSGAVIGADGFGFAPDKPGGGRWEKIEQLGGVSIGDDVEIGANTCIDRGAPDDTVLEDGVKLDNLVQIGHNVRIGAHSAFAGCVGIAGSAVIGKRCTAGGGAIVLGHLQLADDVHVTAATVITRSILKPGQYSGLFPFDDNAAWEKNAATLRQLHSLRDRLKALEKALDGTLDKKALENKTT